MGTFVATSPLEAVIGRRVDIEFGTLSAGDAWVLPPGSVIPPGLHFNNGVLRGVPTIPGTYPFHIALCNAEGDAVHQSYIIEIAATSTISQEAISELIARAFQIGRISSNQKWWMEEIVDPISGKSGLALLVDDNGQNRSIGSIIR